jgi:putative membrane protein
MATLIGIQPIKIRKMKMFKTFAAGTVFAMALLFIQPQSGFAQQTPKLADDEIASVAVVANQNDIDFSKIAQKKSKNAEILKFAQTMAADHQSVIDQAVALVTKLKVTPKDNAVSKKMVADAKKTGKMLNAKSGKSFDKAYIDNEVAYHKAVISAVESVLIPQAQNGELKALLQAVVPTLKIHLEHAEMVQSHISK